MGSQVRVGQGTAAQQDHIDPSGSDLSGSQEGSSVRVIEPIYQPHAVVTALANQVKHRNRQEQDFLNRMNALSSEQMKVSQEQRKAESELAKVREELEAAKRDRDYARSKLELEEKKRELKTANSEMRRLNEEMEAAEMEVMTSESFGVPSTMVQIVQPDGDPFTEFFDSASDITQPVFIQQSDGDMFTDYFDSPSSDGVNPLFIQQPDGRLIQIGDPQTLNEPLFRAEPEDRSMLYDDDTLL